MTKPSEKASVIVDPTVDPENEYATPGELAEDRALSPSQKLALLDRWEFNLQRRLDSASEGMPIAGQEEANESEIIRAIEKARQVVVAESPEFGAAVGRALDGPN